MSDPVSGVEQCCPHTGEAAIAEVAGATTASIAVCEEAADEVDAEHNHPKSQDMRSSQRVSRLSQRVSHLSQRVSSQLDSEVAANRLVSSVLMFETNLSKSRPPTCQTLPAGPITCSRELRFLAGMSIPAAFSFQSRAFQSMVMFAICGQVGTVEQAAVAAAVSWCVTFDALSMANFAQMSMYASAALGSGNTALVGIWLQIFMIFNTGFTIFTIWMRFLAVPIFKHIGFSPSVTSAMQSFVLGSLPSVFFELWYNGLRDWYATRAIMWPEFVVEFITDLLVFPIYGLFVLHMDMGLFGVSVSQTVVSATKFFSYLLLTWSCNCHKECWPGICRDELMVHHRWAAVMRGTLPAMINSTIEGLQMKFLAFYGAAQGEVQAIVVHVVSLFYLISLFFAVPVAEAVGTRVGMYLGMFKIQEAQFCSLGSLACCFCMLTGLGVVLQVLLDPLSRAFSRDPLVIEGIMEVRWALLCFNMSMLLVVCGAVLVKQGRISMLCVSMLLSYVVMVPMFFLMFSFGFTEIGAMIFAQTATFLGLALFHAWNVWRSDWTAAAMRCRQMAEVPMEEAMSAGRMSSLSETPEASANIGSHAIDGGGMQARTKQTDSLPVLLSSGAIGLSTSPKVEANKVDVVASATTGSMLWPDAYQI